MKQVEVLRMHHEEERELTTKVVKRYNLGMSSREIAEELDISIDEAEDVIHKYKMA